MLFLLLHGDRVKDSYCFTLYMSVDIPCVSVSFVFAFHTSSF